MARAPKTRHIFVSTRSEPLPRWVEAFPEAVFQKPGKALPLPAKDVLVWFEVGAGLDLADGFTQLRAKAGSRPLLVLSATPTDDEAMQAFALGAKAYCNAHSSPGNLKLVAGVVQQGGLWLGDTLLQRLINSVSRPEVITHTEPRCGERAPMSGLTERQREVAHAVAAGQHNKEIARRMGITERTVKAHVSAIFDKLKVRDRLQLAILLNRNPTA